VQLALFVPLVVLLALAKVLFVLTPVSVFWIPLAALSMTWAIVHTRKAGLAVGITGAVAASTLFPLDVGLLIVLGAQAVVPPLLMDRVRKRRSPGVAWLGGCAAAVAAYIGYHWLMQGVLPPADLRDLQRSGLLAVVGAAAMSPLLAFVCRPLLQPLLGIVSSARLMRLSDLDHPLLAELAAEAPGTWQHTLAMANMAEVVCTAIGADSKLARVGAYYHDVGKLTNPKCFAENLEGGETSPHLELPPEESAGVIFEHVTEGARLARQHKLPYAVREFIFTHHGDGLLEFFWSKCVEQGNPRDLPEDAFHYPGIRPQTKETAILAVVDAVEAASRTLREPDADRIDSLVRRIVFGKLKAGQLDEAGLTGADLAVVTTTLQEILRSQHHVRPEYPWQKKERASRAREEATVEPPETREPAPAPAPEAAPRPSASPSPEAGPLGVIRAAEGGAAVGVPEEIESPGEEVSAALVGGLSGPVPHLPAPETAPAEAARAPRPGTDMPDDTIREPRPKSGDSDA
jgi:hypothetical protein